MANRVPFSEPQLPFHPEELFARAWQFRNAAMPMPVMINSQPNWPKWALVFHAIELALKAAIVSFGQRGVQQPVGPQPHNHDLAALYAYAIKYGLTDRPEIAKDLPHLAELSVISYARYPMIPVKPAAIISQYDDLVEQIFRDVAAALFPSR
ncbi:hypothetical protein [Bradyrhizobium sp. OAE829]|uniref:hypothetical protein n=1 Tax=Bradyrhizobium sp. OAE829 TaxID=2663807 RepID=UPI00178A924B